MDPFHYDQVLAMRMGFFYYLLPGYMIGAIVHPHAVTSGVTNILLSVLDSDHRIFFGEIRRYLCNRLMVNQKKAVAHWLLLVLQRDLETYPERYVDGASSSLPQRVFRQWQEWA